MRNVSKIPTRTELFGWAVLIPRLNPAAISNGTMSTNERRRRNRRPLLSIVKYANGENLRQVSRSIYGNCTGSAYTAFDSAKPKLRHRLLICGIPEVPNESVLLIKLLDRNAKIFIPESCLAVHDQKKSLRLFPTM
jgi:hypothetical protein